LVKHKDHMIVRTTTISKIVANMKAYFRIFEPMRVLWKNFRDEINLVYTENLDNVDHSIAI